jgi:predicted Zn-dependent peptidase
MSSRLFQELREERGLAYSVGAWAQAYADTGIVAVSCAADRTRAVESMHLARAVLADAVETLGEPELERARAQLEAGLLMSMESAQGRADHMARSIGVFGRILSLDEILGHLRAVDATAAKAAGAALLDGRAAIASVGAQLALAA